MATTFTYMSWNIQVYGPTKWNNNRPRRVNVIARTIDFSGAALVTIMELNANLAGVILTAISNRLNAIRGLNGLVQDWTWTSVIGNATGQTGSDEAYGFLYRTGVLTAATSPNGTVVRGRSTTDQVGNALRFPTKISNTGNGRKPAYCAFRENNTNHLFSVVTYHAPYSNRAILGTRSMALVREAYQVNTANPGGAANWTAVTASIISGDFNINFPDAYTYGPLLSAPPAGPSGTATIFADSTVKFFDPNPPFPPHWAPSVWWRVSAYDNIFCTPNAVPGAASVLDMISELGQWAAGNDATFPPPAGWPAAAAGLYGFGLPQPFNMALEPTGANVIIRPLQAPADSWAFYRLCISDHLPVMAQVTI